MFKKRFYQLIIQIYVVVVHVVVVHVVVCLLVVLLLVVVYIVVLSKCPLSPFRLFQKNKSRTHTRSHFVIFLLCKFYACTPRTLLVVCHSVDIECIT